MEQASTHGRSLVRQPRDPGSSTMQCNHGTTVVREVSHDSSILSVSLYHIRLCCFACRVLVICDRPPRRWPGGTARIQVPQIRMSRGIDARAETVA